MKYVIIIPDGAADLPLTELGNRTPLEVANIPNINFLTKNGKTGVLQTSYHNLPIGSIVANMAILGYDPYKYYPNGRASFEALAKGVTLGKNDIAFRCNLISVEDGKIKTFTANNISDYDASNIINNYKLKYSNFELYLGMSYRHTLVIRNAKFYAHDIKAFEPHMNIDTPINEILIQSKEEQLDSEIQMLNTFILESKEQISELNKIHNTPAHMLWLWSPSSAPNLPNFKEKFGITGAVVSGMDFLKGMAQNIRMFAEHIPNTTGYIDTNFKGKFEAAKRYIRNYDLVYVHINSPDEEAHKKNPYTKIKSLELIDKKIVGPIYEFLKENYSEFRIAIMPDHYTLTKDGTHNSTRVPFCIYGTDIIPDNIEHFNEKEIENNNSIVEIGHNFLKEILLKRNHELKQDKI